MAFDIASLLNSGALGHLLQPNATPGAPNMLAAAAQPQVAPVGDPWAGMREAAPDPVRTGAIAAPQAAQPASSPSFFDRYKNFTNSDRGRALGDFFTGLAMGSTPQQSLGYGARLVSAGSADRRKQGQATAQRNQTVEWLKSRGLSDQDAELLSQNTPALSDYLKNTLSPDAQKPTSDIQNYQFAVQGGYKGNFAQWQKDKGSGVTVNLPGQPNIGTIPQGYAAKQDDQGNWTMQPIPGGPADTSNMDTAKADSKTTKTDVITDAYKKADSLIGSTTTGLIGAGAGFIPPSEAAELRRQTAVLKSNATIENLNAMRAQSPTGGALGNVTEKEGAMLAAAAGALDPNASPEQFKSALDNYYHTLLRIVNGPEAGDKMFNEASGGGVSDSTDLSAMPAPQGVDPNVWKFVPPEKRKLWHQ